MSHTDKSESTSLARMRRAIDTATQASQTLIALRVPPTEIFRVVETVFHSSKENENDFRLWSLLTGWATYDVAPSVRTDEDGVRTSEYVFDPLQPTRNDVKTITLSSAFGALPVRPDNGEEAAAAAYPDKCFYVMLDVHNFFNEDILLRSFIRRQAQRSYSCAQRLFFVFPDNIEVPEEISAFLHVIDFEYPNIEELHDTFTVILSGIEDGMMPDLTEEQCRVVCQNALGMHKTAFESSIGLAISDWYQAQSEEVEDVDDISPVTFEHLCEWVRRYKTEALRKTDVLELQAPLSADRIGGLEYFKEWMQIRKTTFEPEAIAMGITPSRGVLVAGVPGTGKSLIAKAAGDMLGLPVIRFDIGRIFGSFIGQSEGRMRSALKLIDAMAPLVLMVDEVDKGFSGMSGGGNDGGTTSRVFGTFLTWMQERNQTERPVFMVFTANRVRGLPPELLRPGRLDERWAILAPNALEREQIIRIHAGIRKLKVSDEHMPRLVEATAGLVGAEVEALIEQCLVRAYRAKRRNLSVDDLVEERRFMRPIAEAFKSDFEDIQGWVKNHARIASKSPDDLKNAASATRPVVRRPSIAAKPVKRRLN